MMDWVGSLYAYQTTGLKDANPMNVMLIILCVYSLFVNYRFGHPTYWRRSRSVGKLSSIVTNEPTSSDNFTTTNASPKRNMGLILRNVHPDVILHVWSYLTPYDLTVTSRLSRFYRTFCQHPQLWRYHIERLPPLRKAYQLNSSAHIQYFERIKLVRNELLQDGDKLIIRVQANLYDLTNFMHEHPGGDAILTQYKGRDATVMFERVTHSPIALQVRDNLLFFSPEEYTGARGWPKFFIRASSS